MHLPKAGHLRTVEYAALVLFSGIRTAPDIRVTSAWVSLAVGSLVGKIRPENLSYVWLVSFAHAFGALRAPCPLPSSVVVHQDHPSTPFVPRRQQLLPLPGKKPPQDHLHHQKTFYETKGAIHKQNLILFSHKLFPKPIIFRKRIFDVIKFHVNV